MEKLSKQRQLDLLTNAIEGGSNYWYFFSDTSMIIAPHSKPETPEIKAEEPNGCTIFVNRVWETIHKGVKVPVYDKEDEETVLGEISLENLERGMKLMQEQHKEHYDDAIDENDDAETADVFFQLVVMGELTFG